ncbi:MAG: hypothetical protein QXX41_08290 [Nitrososphaerota archaeon]
MNNEFTCLQCGRRIELDQDYHVIVYEYNAKILLNMLTFCDFTCLRRWVNEQG